MTVVMLITNITMFGFLIYAGILLKRDEKSLKKLENTIKILEKQLENYEENNY